MLDRHVFLLFRRHILALVFSAAVPPVFRFIIICGGLHTICSSIILYMEIVVSSNNGLWLVLPSAAARPADRCKSKDACRWAGLKRPLDWDNGCERGVTEAWHGLDMACGQMGPGCRAWSSGSAGA